jgi:hypothetical protein
MRELEPRETASLPPKKLILQLIRQPLVRNTSGFLGLLFLFLFFLLFLLFLLRLDVLRV